MKNKPRKRLFWAVGVLIVVLLVAAASVSASTSPQFKFLENKMTSICHTGDNGNFECYFDRKDYSEFVGTARKELLAAGYSEEKDPRTGFTVFRRPGMRVFVCPGSEAEFEHAGPTKTYEVVRMKAGSPLHKTTGTMIVVRSDKPNFLRTKMLNFRTWMSHR